MNQETAYLTAFLAIGIAVLGCWAGDLIWKWTIKTTRQQRLDEILPPPEPASRRTAYDWNEED
jgi:hypothetical protein